MTKLENNNSNSSLQEGLIDLNEPEELIDIVELLELLWKGKKIIISIATAFFLITVIYTLKLPNIYKSSASMSVVESSNSGGGISLTGLGGIGLGVAEFGVKGPRYVNTVRSRGFFKHLNETDKEFLPKLMAAKDYDPESKKLTFDSNVYDEVNKKWLVEEPHYLDGYTAYMGKIGISYHQERHIIDIWAEHISPITAKEMLDSVINEADKLLRKFDLERSDESLEYLNEAIVKQQQLALRNAMNDMILKQLENQMMTKIGPHYIVDIVDPPFVPRYKNKPNRTFICLSAGAVGLVVGILFVLMRQFLLRKLASRS